MKHFLETYKRYEGTNQDLIAYAAELVFNKELTHDLEERYDDMLEVLEEELEEQGQADNPMYDNDTEHLLSSNEI